MSHKSVVDQKKFLRSNLSCFHEYWKLKERISAASSQSNVFCLSLNLVGSPSNTSLQDVGDQGCAVIMSPRNQEERKEKRKTKERKEEKNWPLNQ